MAFVSLDYIVKNFLIEKGKTSKHEYQSVLALALRGTREVSFILPHFIKTVSLPVNDNLTVDFPKDYVDYTAIGVISDGRLYFLSHNPRLYHPISTDDCGNEENANQGKVDSLDFSTYPYSGYWFSNYAFAEGYGRIFGYGGAGINTHGYYREDLENSRFIFDDRLTASEIYLEYKSNGIQPDGSALIPEQAIETIIEWVHWRQSKRKGERTPVSQKMYNEKNYKHARRDLVLRVNGFTLSEFLDKKIQYTMLAPKTA